MLLYRRRSCLGRRLLSVADAGSCDVHRQPMLSDLRESGAIEQDADIVIFLYRDEVYKPDTPKKGIAELIIGKHRNGRVGTVELAFLPQYTAFEPLAKDR